MVSISSFSDSTSSFFLYATATSRTVIIQQLRVTARKCNATLDAACHIYFHSANYLKKIIDFKLSINKYLRICCDEYLSIHQQIADKKLQKSDLNEDNMDHYVYCTMEKIMSQNDGYKHLNCIFDDVMKFCSFQFEHIFVSLMNDDYSIAGTRNSCDGNFNYAEMNIIRSFIQSYLDKANENFHDLRTHTDEYKNFCLKCEENDCCELKIENVKQRLEQQAEIMQQEAQNCEH